MLELTWYANFLLFFSIFSTTKSFLGDLSIENFNNRTFYGDAIEEKVVDITMASVRNFNSRRRYC